MEIMILNQSRRKGIYSTISRKSKDISSAIVLFAIPNLEKSMFISIYLIFSYPCPDRKHFFSRTGEYKARLKKGEYERKNYVWLLDQLCSPTEKIRGCHVNVCETVGFENGKPVHIIKMDKDNCVYKITSPVKLNLRQIMKDFKSPACLVSEQKKEFFDTNTISGSIIPVFPEPLKVNDL